MLLIPVLLWCGGCVIEPETRLDRMSPAMRAQRVRLADVGSDVQRSASQVSRALSRSAEVFDWIESLGELAVDNGRGNHEVRKLAASIRRLRGAAGDLLASAEVWAEQIERDKLAVAGGRSLYEADRLVDQRRVEQEQYSALVEAVVRQIDEALAEAPVKLRAIEAAWAAEGGSR